MCMEFRRVLFRSGGLRVTFFFFSQMSLAIVLSFGYKGLKLFNQTVENPNFIVNISMKMTRMEGKNLSTIDVHPRCNYAFFYII